MGTRTLATPVSAPQYPRLSAVQAVRKALGCQPSTAKQFLKESDPRSPFARGALIIEALRRNGHGNYADKLLVPMRLADRIAVRGGIDDELRAREQHIDGIEDEVGTQFDRHPSRATWLVYRAALIRYEQVLLETIRCGDAEYGSPSS